MTETTATEVQVPPKPGTLSWWELQVPDPEQAKRFYGAVLGWTFQSFGDGYDVINTSDGTMIGGLDSQTAKGESPAGRGVRVYVQVEDLEAALDRVTANGGEIRNPRQLISEEYGWSANFADPSGLTIGLMTTNPAG